MTQRPRRTSGTGTVALLLLSVLVAGCTRGLEIVKYEEAAGYRLGRRVLEETSATGPILVLRSPSGQGSDEPTAARFRGLRDACSGRELIEAGPDLLELGPPYEAFYILPGEDWTRHLSAWCRQYPEAVAVVSLLFEFPPLGETWGEDMPPVYGFHAGPSRAWVAAMQQGRLRALVRYREGVQDAPARGATRSEVFDHRFELVTPGR